MQDSARGSAVARERASAEGSNVSGKRRPRRRWSAEEKVRVVRESLRPGKRVGEVAGRYGISRWQLSTWRSLARQRKLAVASSAEPVNVEPRPRGAPHNRAARASAPARLRAGRPGSTATTPARKPGWRTRQCPSR